MIPFLRSSGYNVKKGKRELFMMILKKFNLWFCTFAFAPFGY